MRIAKVIEEINDVYKVLDAHLAKSAHASGLKCPDYCGHCCMKTDIEASPVEFFQLAVWLYENNQVNEFLEKLDNPQHPWCGCFDPDAASKGTWGCQYYEHRGLICRLFGFGYRLNRENMPVLVTCKIMKSSHPEAIKRAGEMAQEHPEEMPVFSNYFMQLLAIEPELAILQLPINEAIRTAIEKLYFYYLDYADGESSEENPE